MKNFEVTIGIEVHCVLNTKTKMFSSSKNSHDDFPNTNVNEVDLGIPGTLPSVNEAAVKKAIWLAKELNMECNYQNICFDRKNYFYSDLTKGFQITQQYFPIATNGYIDIGTKKIRIERFHLEEDTAKQLNIDGNILLDYNRCGAPLIEIVTKPDINSAQEATQYLKNLINILKFTDISDAKLESGSLRADINISLRPYGAKKYGTKVEIKNINSISNVAKAIDFEINRQTKLLLLNQHVNQETRRFDDNINETIFMREKHDSVDYRYIYEPNILKVSLSDDEYEEYLNLKPKSIFEITNNLKNENLSNEEINFLLNNYELFLFFNEISKKASPKIIYNWICTELVGLLNKQNKTINDFTKEQKMEFLTMIDLLNQEEINGKQAKIILEKIVLDNKKTLDIIKENNMQQIKDKIVIRQLLEEEIQKNPKMLNEYGSRPERVEKFFMGQIMKKTQGQANPNVTIEVLKEMIK